MQNDKICFIFGALKTSKLPVMPKQGDLVIAADAGLCNLQALQIKPSLVIGDFDSLGKVPTEENYLRLPVRKDDTDVGYAVKYARERDFNSFVIYGAVGGRLDLTIANLQIAADIAQNAGKCLLLGDECSAAVIHNGKLHFNGGSGRLSVFSLSEKSEGVSVKNASFELENGTLTSSFPLGVSNEFCEKPIEISVKQGTLAVIWETAEIPEIL